MRKLLCCIHFISLFWSTQLWGDGDVSFTAIGGEDSHLNESGLWWSYNWYVDTQISVLDHGYVSDNTKGSGRAFFGPGARLKIATGSHAGGGPGDGDYVAWSDISVGGGPSFQLWHDDTYGSRGARVETLTGTSVSITVQHKIKNKDYASGSYTLTRDATGPEFQLSGLPSSWVNGAVPLPFTVSGYTDTQSGVNLSSSTYTIDQQTSATVFSLAPGNTYTGMLNVSTLGTGAHLLTITMYDNVGNATVHSAPFYIDKSPPRVAVPHISLSGTAITNDIMQRGSALDASVDISPPESVQTLITESGAPALTLSLARLQLYYSKTGSGSDFAPRTEQQAQFEILRTIPHSGTQTAFNANGYPTGVVSHTFDLTGLPTGYYRVGASATDATGYYTPEYILYFFGFPVSRTLAVDVPGNVANLVLSSDENVFVYVPEATITITETSPQPPSWSSNPNPTWQINMTDADNSISPAINVRLRTLSYSLYYTPVISTPNWSMVGTPVTKTLDLATADSYVFSIGGDPANPATKYPIDPTSVSADGYYRLVITATDASDLTSSQFVSSTYHFDTTPPVVPEGSTSYTNGSDPLVWSLNPVDNLSGLDWSRTVAIQQHLYNGSFASDEAIAAALQVSGTPESATFTLPAPAIDGTYRLWGTTRDNAGNTASFSSSTIVVDHLKPTVSVTAGISADQNQFTKSQTVPVSIAAADELSLLRKVTVTVKDSSGAIVWGPSVTSNEAPLPASVTLGSAAGDYTVEAIAEDNAGNSGSAAQLVHYVPGLPGTIANATYSWDSPVEGTNGLTLAWTGLSAPTGDMLTYTLDPSPGFNFATVSGSGATGSVDLGLAGYDTNVTLTVRITDLAKNVATGNIAIRTKAKLGTLGAPPYKTTAGNLAVIGYTAGRANDTLVATNNKNSFDKVLGSFNSSNNTFSFSGLTSHAEYSLELSGQNSAVPAQRTTRAIEASLTVENNLPSAPVIATSGTASAPFWAGPNRALTWSSSDDFDVGDSHTYGVSTKLRPSGSYVNQVTTSGLSFTPTAPLGFVTGSAYDWKVTVLDDHNGSKTSTVSTFNYDGAQPTVDWVEGTWPLTTYLNGTTANGDPLEVQFKIGDANSGVGGVVAYWDDQTASPLALSTPSAGRRGVSTWPTSSGLHTLTVVVNDVALNTKSISKTDVDFDATAPTISWAPTGNVNVATTTYTLGTGTVADDRSQVASIEMQWSNGSHTGAWQTMTGSGASVSLSGRNLQVDVPDGIYSLNLRATDQAGNISNKTSAATYTIDVGSLVVSQTVTRYLLSRGTRFISDLANLSVTIDAYDPVSSAITTAYGVAVAGATPTWKTTWATAASAMQPTLISGSIIQIWTRATNGVGTTVAKVSETLVFDKSPPTGLSLVSPSASVKAGDSLRIEGGGLDADSGIDRFRLSIGTTADPTSISRLLTGSVNERLVSTEAGPVAFNITLPASVPAGTYRAVLAATNGAGLTATLVKTLTIASGTNPVSVVDNGPYAAHLQASFGAAQADSFQYQIVNATDSVTLIDWTPLLTGKKVFDSDTELTDTQRSLLVDGKKYTIKARRVYQGEVQPTIVTSTGVILDRSVPTVGSAQAVTAGGTPVATTFTDGSSLNLTWTTASSLYSPLKSLTLQITAGGQVYPLSLPPELERPAPYTLSGLDALPLTNGMRLDLSLIATAQNGATGERVLPAVFVSKGLPNPPVVVTNAKYNNTGQPMAAQWLATSQNGVSPVSYGWVLTKTPENPGANWNSDGGTFRAEQSPSGLANGEIWYFVVRATNDVGASSIAVSEGITIDTTAPTVADVRLLYTNGGITGESVYVNTKNNLSLAVKAYSAGSAVKDYLATFQTSNGTTLVAAGTVSSHSQLDESGLPTGIVSLSATDTATIPNVSLSPGYPAGMMTSTVYKAWATNAAGTVSVEPGVSAPVVYDTSRPAVAAVRAQISGDQLVVNWDPDLSGTAIPIDHYIVTVSRGGTVVATKSSPARSLGLSVSDTTVWTDATYEVQLVAVNRAGTSSLPGDPRATTRFFVDRIVPTLTASIPTFVNASLGITASAPLPISGVTRWRYQVGTLASPGLLTDGWKTVLTNATGLSPSLAVVDLAEGAVEVADGSLLQAQIQVQNGAGLWSQVLTTNVSLVDQTDPTISGLAVSAYSNRKNLVGGVGFTVGDSQSGLAGYRYGLRDSSNVLVGNQWTTGAPTNTASSVVSDLQISYPADLLNHGGQYRLVVQAQNRTGTWSDEASPTQLVSVDTIAPVWSFANPRTDGRTEPVVDGDGATEFVVNSLPIPLTITVEEDVSPSVTATISVTNPEKAVSNLTTTYANSGSFTLSGSLSGVYRIEVTVSDLAGNTSTTVQQVRLNTAPTFVLRPISSTPGQPVPLEVVNLADADTAGFGDQVASYLWSFGDGTPDSTSVSPTHSFGSVGTYQVGVTVTDSWGGITTATIPATVANTVSGTLYANETWLDERTVTGQVVVPNKVTLTIAATGKVRFRGNEIAGYGQGLKVEKGGTLIVAGGAVLSADSGQTAFWDTLWIAGTANIGAADISGAERGITVDAGSLVTLNGTTLRGNEIGLHVAGAATVNVTSTSFLNNLVYGVKEEAGVTVVIKNSVFHGNLRSYYRGNAGPISMAKLNALPNVGNDGE